MPGAIPTDAEPEGTLADARSAALASLKQDMPGYSPMGAPGRGSAAAPGPTPIGTPAPDPTDDEAQGGDEGPAGFQSEPAPPPSKDAAAADNGQVGWDSFKNFLHDTFKGTGAELANVGPRVAAKWGGWLTNAAAGAAFVTDKLAGRNDHLEDAVFNFKKNYVDPAVEHWTPDRSAVTGEGTGSGPGAAAIGEGLEAAPAVAAGIANPVAGAAALTQLVSAAGTDSSMTELDKGNKLSTAVGMGAVDAIATAVQARIGVVPTLPLLKRVITSIGAGDLVTVASNVAKKIILSESGYDKQAQALNATDGLGAATIQNAIFGLTPGHGKEPAKAAAPPSAASAGPAVAGTPAEAAPAAPAPPTAAVTPTPAPPSAVVDKPTAEPAKDLRAQFRDMNDPATPRTGVFLSSDNLTNIGASKNSDAATLRSQTTAAAKQGRVVDTGNGMLVLKTKSDADAARTRLTAGEDPQAIIGSYTGAGTGKTAGASVVVQGQNPDGSVATEATVEPHKVDDAVQTAIDQGKIPHVGTPDAVIQRRERLVSEENAQPTTDEQTQAKPAEPAAPVEPSAAIEPAKPAEPAAESKPPEMGMFTTNEGKEVPVHIEPGAEEGKTRVRPIDASTGESSEHTIDVPSGKVRTGSEVKAITETPAPEVVSRAAVAGVGETEEYAPAEQAPSTLTRAEETTGGGIPRKPLTALEALPEALDQHVQQEVPPAGKKFAGSLAERQDNASAFAQVLKAAAKEAGNTASVEDVARATSAAKAAEGLTLKSKNATDKGQGTSHTRLDAIVAELHKAARALIGKAKPGDEEVVKPIEAETKAKIIKARAKAAEPATEKPRNTPTEKPSNARESIKDRLRLQKLSKEYLTADEKDAAPARAKIEQWLHETTSAMRPQAERDQIMHFLDEQRREQRGEEAPTGRLSDTMEDEDELKFDRPEEGFSTTYRPQLFDASSKVDQLKSALSSKRLRDEWHAATVSLHGGGFFERMSKFRDSGEPLGAKFLMRQVIENTHTPVLRSMLTEIAARMPDVPVYNVSDIKNLGSNRSLGSGVAGLFSRLTNAVQVDFDRSGRLGETFQLRTLVHELLHAASIHELDQNVNGKFAGAMHRAYETLVNRLKSKYGEDTINKHIDYFNDLSGAIQKPDDFLGHLYGITNVHEMNSEIWTNPEFVREVAESEDFASPREEGVGAPNSDRLITKIFKAIGNFFGVNDPQLLQHILDTSLDVMEAQGRHARFMSKSSLEFHNALPESARAALGATPHELAAAQSGLEAVHEAAPKLRGTDDAMSRAFAEDATDEPVQQARNFVHVTKDKTIDAIRKVAISFKTMGQLFRDHMHDFGSDNDPTNPLRQLQEASIHKNVLIKKLRDFTNPVAKSWMKLKEEDSRALGQLMIDSTMYKIDPRLPLTKQPLEAQARDGAAARHADYQARLAKLSPEAREVYSTATDANKRLMREMRMAGVDTGINAFDLKLTDAQKGLLYGAKRPEIYDSIIGPGRLIDVGDKNDALRNAMHDFAAFTEVEGPYHHLGRQGDYVVHAEPEGTKGFATESKAREFASTVNDLSPDSKGIVSNRGGAFVVDYKAKYTSMHETRGEAEATQGRLREAGFDIGHVTQKTMGKESAPLSHGLKELVSEAERKIAKNGGKDEGTEAMVASLRSAFLQMTAARSAYASSRLARKNIGGVKAGDMRRNFAEHAASTIWHAAQLRTVFEQAAAMAKVRAMARDAADAHVTQKTMYRRGKVVEAFNKHANDEVANFGHKAPFNSMMAKLGFMSYLASPSHAAIWMTQNFTTGLPVAGARWGYGKAIGSFGKAMTAVTGPSFRAAMKEVFSRGGSASEVNEAVVAAIRKNPAMAKWASGANSPLQQLIDRGIISHGYADELGEVARGDSARVARLFEWARIMPAMADSFNRVSTALAGLEMTGGDIRKTADFVQEIHADYSQENKPLAFKKIGRVWGANSITMFKTYAQEMIHLTYGNLIGSFRGENKVEAAKTLAGLVIGNALFAGVYGGIALEPLRMALYAYHKVADDEGDVWDLKNSIHKFLVDHFGKGVGNSLAEGPIPHALGIDLSSRMGLADLFFHNPPDLLSADKDMWKTFIMDEAGPMPQLLANNVSGFVGHLRRGEPFQAVSSVIPVKAYQDSMKALELFNTGKQDSLGSQLTSPSAMDAVRQAAGFKPSSVAEAQEKQGVRIEYSAAAKSAKQDIIKQLISSKPGSNAYVTANRRMNEFNSNHPYEAIRGGDISRMMRAQEMTSAGIGGRDPTVNEATDF